MEHDEVLVQKVQRELDDWMEKCSQAEKRRDQLDFALQRKTEELSEALSDAQVGARMVCWWFWGTCELHWD